MAERLECDRSYLSKLETGRNRRCSTGFLSRLVAELGHIDRRALMVCAREVLLIEGRGRSDPPLESGVYVNGIALRTLRVMFKVKRGEFAGLVGVTVEALVRLEATQAANSSPNFVARAAVALGVNDRRALLACPYGDQPHEQRWNPDSDVPTAPFARPVGVHTPAAASRFPRHSATEQVEA